MSLTSYRAAPPRGDLVSCRERFCGLFRSGGDLLSRVLGRSTIGAAVLNGRVRDGIGCFTRARTTRPGKPARGGRLSPLVLGHTRRSFLTLSGLVDFRRRRVCRLPDRIEACRAISTGQLNALPRLYLRPIDVVVFHGPQGRPGFEGGFPLRCLQRLSCPHIATLHCRWHDNRSTSGAFTPVLSY
jgi:hypothetical protein